MSRSSLRTHRLAVATAVLAGGLVASTASIATADPPALNVTPCGSPLASADTWPGTLATPGGEVRLVSDAFVSYLARQPECTATGG
jgi:hypothetical protein